MKTVIITGVAGMDGSTLAEKLLTKGYYVIGVGKWTATGKYPNLDECIDHVNFKLITGDITEKHFMENLIKEHKPDYLYNLAAISLVPESFKIPNRVLEVNTMAVLNMLESIRHHSPKTRFYQASSSEQIGSSTEKNQSTESNMRPNSPYAIAKLASYYLVKSYRRAYGIFAVNGMLWNHEGPRRGYDFVTRKISRGVANILNKDPYGDISLGNLDAYRDWGISDDYCDAMILMMEAKKPDDYAVATGECHSVREFVEEAFKVINLHITWKGKGLKEVGVDQHGFIRVRINKEFYRPTEVEFLSGNASKIKRELGWYPKTKFKELVRMMVENDIASKNND
jgi:GDPmannose 4,6-dehydratase